MGPVVWLKVKSTQFKEIFIKTNQLLRTMNFRKTIFKK